jgi:hypothetical protein
MAMPKKPKLPIDVLSKHLLHFKDAVIILGPDILGEGAQFEINEETKDNYNRKLMIREPEQFWKYYSDNIMKPLAISNKITAQVNNLLNLNLHSMIIDTNIVRSLASTRKDVIDPNGKNDTLECVKCQKKYDANSMFNQLQKQETTLKCNCGGNIKPTVLYHGEKYNMNIYKAVKDAIFVEENGVPKLNTHTLIFIGVDFTDTLISELIDSYDALKNDLAHYTVIITDKLNRDDLIYYNPEFGTCDDLDEAIKRLITLIKETETE